VFLSGLLLVGCGDTDSGIANLDLANTNVNNNQLAVVNLPVAGSFSLSTTSPAQVVRAAQAGRLCTAIRNNVCNSILLGQNSNTASFQAEDFANLGTVNVGTVSTVNTIIGTCGFP
jgi:hypothetical protein